MVDSQPGTGPQVAPRTRYIMPNQMKVERVGTFTSGVVAKFPEVRGGTCEYCGVVDQNVDSKEIQQYQLCPHYRGMVLRCRYCPASKDASDISAHSVLRVLQHPDKPDTLLIHCNSFECMEKLKKEFQVANA